MADELSSAIVRLRTSTERINKITDTAASYVKQVEMFLEEAGVGVSARTEVTKAENSMFLEYRRLSTGKFRIALVQEDGALLERERAWSECSREEKLLSFGKLPDLLLELEKKIDEQAEEAENALAIIGEKLPLFKKKKGE